MSTSNFLSAVDVANKGGSHHSVAMDNYTESDHATEDIGVTEKPLGRFEKSFFALVSGYDPGRFRRLELIQ